MDAQPLVKLDTYLPAAVGGSAAWVWQLGTDSIVVDLSEPLSPGASCSITIVARPELSVTLAAQVMNVQESSARWRHVLRLDPQAPAVEFRALLSTLRKTAHLDLVRGENVEARFTSSGWADVRLRHDALPELAEEEIATGASFLSKSLRAPIIISGMTGGSPRARDINLILARTAEKHGFAFGLGSQRTMHELPELANTYEVRKVAPTALLLANVGAVQLAHGLGVEDVRALVERVGADALAVHLNALQELVQPEGDRDFRGLKPRIADLVAKVGVPVVLKETGSGIGGPVARWAASVGVAAVDVGGAGGTSWARVEGLRSAREVDSEVGETFRDWGIPTAQCVAECARDVPNLPLIATGGVRTGLDVAKALALGATLGGLALPFFRAADQGEEAVEGLAIRLVRELRIAMVCAGAIHVSELASSRVLPRGPHDT